MNSVVELLNKKIRIEKKITQKELANQMNVSAVAVHKWLQGGDIDITKIPQLCNILEVSPNEIFGISPDEERAYADALYKAFKDHPEYQESIKQLLNISI